VFAVLKHGEWGREVGKLTVTAKRRAEWDGLEAQLSGCLRGLEKKGAPRLEHDPAIPKSPGIYLFLEKDGTPIYVGQSRNLRTRLAQHCVPSGGHNSASLAFNIAKAQHEDDFLPRTRSQTQRESEFEPLFKEAKESLEQMEVRWIEVESAELRTVLEVYIAVLLGTKHNSFETH
jgi:hypothetical protein